MFELPFQLYRLLGTAHNGLLKFVLISYRIFCEPLDFPQNHLFQKIHTDIMGRGTVAPATVVIGAVEILDIVISLIEVVVQVVTAIRAYQQTAKHIPFSIFGFPSADLSALFLNLFPDGTVNNWLMYILENDPVFTVIGNSLLVLIRLGIGLEVQYIPAILLQ